MSYNRTVVCSHCRRTGHNRRTCPSLKEYIKENPDSYTAHVTAESNAKGRIRSCKYCRLEGHNKQTCPKLLSDSIAALTTNQKFRKETLARFKDLGIGLGTLFSYKGQGTQTPPDNEILLMVDEIKWDNIVYRGCYYDAIMVNKHGERATSYCMNITQLFDLLREGYLIIEHPASEDNIGVGIPADWFKGTSNLQEAFSDWNPKLAESL